MKGARLTDTGLRGVLLLAALFTGCVHSPQSQSLPSAPESESAPPETTITREVGRHDLPFQPNERFILQWVYPERRTDETTDIVLVYFLDGKRREWVMGGPRSTDGYVTELGWLLTFERYLLQERVILLPSGEKITVQGNTIHQGEQVWLKTLEASEPVEFGRSSIAAYAKD